MPKKFRSVNTKAEAARERKASAKEATAEKKQREEDDQFWQDDDKHVARKQDRKADREKRRVEQLERKQAAKQLLEEEEAKVGGKSRAAKVTRAEIETAQRREGERLGEAAGASALPKGVSEAAPLEENPNLLMRQRELEGHVDAQTVDEAIAVLSEAPAPVDRHPEKRMKAAYLAFEERELPRLKAENPNLRLSQIKQMLRKDWMKSPENPMNEHLSGAS